MILLKEAFALNNYIKKQAGENKKTGFVPTMGALHAGHISLIEMSKQQCDITICSIFVNPTQFNDPKDFEKYPVTIAEDILKLEKAGCDILFLPFLSEIYPEGLINLKHYDLGELENKLEGKFRPGHFQGVCQVVDRLLCIVKPHLLFIGQKDYQQCMVIKKLVSLTGLATEVVIGNTLREPTGLAMSSRNQRLSAGQKETATAIYKVLTNIKSNYKNSDINALVSIAEKDLLSKGFSKIDYVTIADAETLEAVTHNVENKKLVALVAAFIGEVRLIDNMLLS